MKILYLIHRFYPESYAGTQKFCLNISTMMQRFGHEVKVLTYSFYKDLSYNGTYKNLMIKSFKYKNIPVTAIRFKKEPFVRYNFYGNEDSKKIAKDVIQAINPDIIHMLHPGKMGDFIEVAGDLGIPYIITLTDFMFMCPKGIMLTSDLEICEGPDEGEQCKRLCRETINSTDNSRYKKSEEILVKAKSIISPSKFIADMFNNEFENINVQVVNHGIDYSKIIKNRRVYKMGDKINFCYAGTIAYHKGVHVILDAFEKIYSNNFSLKIYGAGEYDLYNNKLSRIDKNKEIEFCGIFNEEEVGEVFSNVDVVIVPSLWYENYPLVLHEALACNVPIITSNIGGMKEKIKDGINGFTFNVGNSEELKRIIEKIIENPEILNSLKENIGEFSVPTLEKEAKFYELEYKSILQL